MINVNAASTRSHVTDHPSQTQPWYRQFWPWLLIFFPACAVIGGIITYLIAAQSPHQPIDNGYEKVGLTVIATDREARSTGASISIENQRSQIPQPPQSGKED